MSDETIAARTSAWWTTASTSSASGSSPTTRTQRNVEEDARRLEAVQIELDRCWDLLRQRRALRDAGANPDDAEARDASTVERYLQ